MRFGSTQAGDVQYDFQAIRHSPSSCYGGGAADGPRTRNQGFNRPPLWPIELLPPRSRADASNISPALATTHFTRRLDFVPMRNCSERIRFPPASSFGPPENFPPKQRARRMGERSPVWQARSGNTVPQRRQNNGIKLKDFPRFPEECLENQNKWIKSDTCIEGKSGVGQFVHRDAGVTGWNVAITSGARHC
jgi:hypothetical protein